MQARVTVACVATERGRQGSSPGQPETLLGWLDEQLVHRQGVLQAPAHQALLLRLQQAHEVVPAPERGLGVEQAGGLGAGDG